MRLYLENFRCHSQFECEFINGVTLIRGRSGLGKTTLFNAIVWCLYGTNRNKEIKNCKPDKKCDTVVILDLHDYIIERRNNPMRLSVKFHDRELVEDEAQTFIENEFGDYKFFLCTSYIMQKDKCKFLTLDSKDKTKILRKLSLRDEDPKLYIKRIDEILHDIYDKLRKNTEILNSIKIDTNIDQSVTPDTITELKSQLDEKTNEYQEALRIDTENKAKISIIQSQTARLKCIESQLQNVTKRNLEPIKNQLQQLREAYKIHLKYLQDKPKVDEITKQLSNLPQGDPIENLDKLEATQRKREQYLQTCKRWKVDYTEQAIAERLQLLSNRHLYKENEIKKRRKESILNRLKSLPSPAISSQELGSLQERHNQQLKAKRYGLKLNQVEQRISEIQSLLKQYERKQDYDKAVQLDKRITELKSQKTKFSIKLIPEDRQKELEDKRLLLTTMSQSIGVIKCPHCNKGVRYINGILKPENHDPVDMQKYNMLKRDVAYLTEEQRKREEIIENNKLTTEKLKTIENEINKLQALRDQIGEVTAPPTVDVNKLQVELRDLQSVSDLSEEIDIELYRKREERGRLEQELLNLGEIKNYKFIDLTTAEQEYTDLSRIKVIDPIDVDIELEKKKALRKQLEKQLTTLTLTDPADVEKLPLIEEEYNMAVKENETYDRLTVEMSSIKQTLSEIVVTEVDLQRINEELQQLKSKYEFSVYSLEMLETIRKYKLRESYVNKLKQNINALGNLKDIINNVDNKLLEDVVSLLNSKITETLNYMFNDDNLIVEFKVFKELKNGKLKPYVNLEIQYKGIDYSDISQLSGGEMDRVSMCVAIALNSLNKSGFLLLDETMSSLDADCRETCVKILRAMNCPVVVINHEDNDGNYDNVVVLS